VENAVTDAPGASRTAASYAGWSALTVFSGANGQLTRAIGSLLFWEPVGTIWSSKTTTAVTRNASVTALLYSGRPLGVLGTPYRRSVPPGARCSRLASRWSTMACPRAAGSNSRPATILTRSTLTPRALSELDNRFTGVGLPGDSVKPKVPKVVIAAMCGSRASAPK
jgi:hypothetical protein